jgi:hypothetical protein
VVVVVELVVVVVGGTVVAVVVVVVGGTVVVVVVLVVGGLVTVVVVVAGGTVFVVVLAVLGGSVVLVVDAVVTREVGATSTAADGDVSEATGARSPVVELVAVTVVTVVVLPASTEPITELSVVAVGLVDESKDRRSRVVESRVTPRTSSVFGSLAASAPNTSTTPPTTVMNRTSAVRANRLIRSAWS